MTHRVAGVECLWRFDLSSAKFYYFQELYHTAQQILCQRAMLHLIMTGIQLDARETVGAGELDEPCLFLALLVFMSAFKKYPPWLDRLQFVEVMLMAATNCKIIYY